MTKTNYDKLYASARDFLRDELFTSLEGVSAHTMAVLTDVITSFVDYNHATDLLQFKTLPDEDFDECQARLFMTLAVQALSLVDMLKLLSPLPTYPALLIALDSYKEAMDTQIKQQRTHQN